MSLIKSTIAHHLIPLLLQLRQVVLILVIGHLNEILQAEVGCNRSVLHATERTGFLLSRNFVDACFAESMAAREKNVGLMGRRQEQFEADRARV